MKRLGTAVVAMLLAALLGGCANGPSTIAPPSDPDYRAPRLEDLKALCTSALPDRIPATLDLAYRPRYEPDSGDLIDTTWLFGNSCKLPFGRAEMAGDRVFQVRVGFTVYTTETLPTNYRSGDVTGVTCDDYFGAGDGLIERVDGVAVCHDKAPTPGVDSHRYEGVFCLRMVEVFVSVSALILPPSPGEPLSDDLIALRADLAAAVLTTLIEGIAAAP